MIPSDVVCLFLYSQGLNRQRSIPVRFLSKSLSEGSIPFRISRIRKGIFPISGTMFTN